MCVATLFCGKSLICKKKRLFATKRGPIVRVRPTHLTKPRLQGGGGAKGEVELPSSVSKGYTILSRPTNEDDSPSSVTETFATPYLATPKYTIPLPTPPAPSKLSTISFDQYNGYSILVSIVKDVVYHRILMTSSALYDYTLIAVPHLTLRHYYIHPIFFIC